MSFMLMPSREVRVIQAGWQHPRHERGHYVGLMTRDALAYEPDPEAPITEADCMPLVDEYGPTEIAAYETVSEGTPISPAFPNTPDGKLAMLSWLAENAGVPGSRDQRTSIEAWASMLYGAAMVNIETGAVESTA